MNTDSPFDPVDPSGSARRWAEGAAHQYLPALFCGRPPSAQYCMPDRHGVRTLALSTTDLSDRQRTTILRFRLAQYVLLGYVDPEIVAARGMTHEPLDAMGPNDIHILAGATDSGEILSYSILARSAATVPGTTLGDRERPLLALERACGWGVLNHLYGLRDLPLSRIVEGGRFVKCQGLGVLDERGIRAPIEVIAAITHLLLGPLQSEVDALVGETEDRGALRNAEFHHCAIAVLPGVVPLTEPDDLLYPLRSQHHVMPFALSIRDFEAALPRLLRVEAALDLPGEEGLSALLDLKHDIALPPSSLIPPGGLPALATVRVCGPQTSLAERRRLRALGRWLTRTAVFETLSEAEAAVVAALARERRAGVGEMMAGDGQGQPALSLLHSGSAEILVFRKGFAADSIPLHAGELFSVDRASGDAASSAQVFATSDVTWLEWDAETCATYLRPLPDLRSQLDLHLISERMPA